MSNDNLADFIRGHREEFDGETPPPSVWDRIESCIEPERDDKTDPLREFIAIHRDEFDDATPPPQLADRIFAPALRALPRRKQSRISFIMGIAASMLLLVSAAYFLGSKTGYNAARQAQAAVDLSRIDPDLADAERYYQEEIAVQFTRVNHINNDPQLRRDLEEIDKATAEIRADLLEVPVSQRAVLVNQLIETYRTKLGILLRIQQHLPRTGPAAQPNKTTDES